ncbi:FKBP-type peptidyl-prolyl cis-trans isomerase [Geobacter hydrogenophilus]|uniref:Peptidyl-prolyl cis-trans isomerase n=1 Tax=Geobacter hydrogenophilus TaxID=40983 RepID=A0A9W6LCZ6_9BACT|nr:FKBP-type peptidyl-prolyl cis-trans isomerase N-terminal domain-containing protein [Geobacter hydrogenophilus]MBT0894458.1 FKBP-type peptidyl-prolyl cis-trans isomerase [Geobacter hydrogenophilus]GLI39387.1 FKBP-type 22 kDa peptidyl-prolyl cis-trans isomerase [Geobacter hydrogenophilus]
MIRFSHLKWGDCSRKSPEFAPVLPCLRDNRGARRSIPIGIWGLILLSCSVSPAVSQEIKGEKAKLNYSVGYQVGSDFKANGVELDSEALMQGVRDAINQKGPSVSTDEMHTVLIGLKKKIDAAEQSSSRQKSAEYRQASEKFLQENARKEGVKVLPDGVQYKIIREGSGKMPTLNDDVKVHYRISRIDGKELGNTYDGGIPRTVSVAKALPALKEVLPKMPEGSKWQIVIPTATAAGGRDPLNEQGVLIYDVELLSVVPPQ